MGHLQSLGGMTARMEAATPTFGLALPEPCWQGQLVLRLCVIGGVAA